MIPKKPTRKKAGAKSRRHSANQPVGEKLPEAYGTERLFLVARDPRWLYAHWDFTREQQHAYNHLARDGHLLLRIYQETPGERLVAQVKLQTDSRHWFVPVGRGETQYIAELGYRPRRGKWTAIARSSPVVTPPETIAPDTSVQLATIPPDVPLPQVLKTLDATAANKLPLVEALQAFRAAGHPGLPEFSVSSPERHWTLQQAQELDQMAGAQRIRTRIWDEVASLTAAHILPAAVSSLELTGPDAAELIEAETNPSSPTGGWSGDLN